MTSFHSFIMNDYYNRYLKQNDRLDMAASLIDWESFRPITASCYHNMTEMGGRPNIDCIVMLKLLVLQQWYGLSDPALEREVAKNIFFQHFIAFPETLRRFHEANPEDTKVIFFDGVDIPNINKLSLYGSGLADTSLYNDYLSHGAIWYIVFKSRRYGIVAGVTRSSVVTSFSEIQTPEFLGYIKEEVFPLID